MIKGVLLGVGPSEGDGFALVRAGQGSEGLDDVGISGDKTAALDEETECRAEFV